MDPPSTSQQTVLTTKQRSECFEARLVLHAAGIAADANFHDGVWTLLVEHDVYPVATAELAAYRAENVASPTRELTPFPVHGGAAVACWAYAATLILVAILAAESAFGYAWDQAGRMQAGKVMAGEGWRVVTALTLHLDLGHILGNLLFGTVFGLLAGRILGGGVAWLGIVIAGALGNWMNAWAQAGTHTSIGASTAVFGALGMIVAHALCRWALTQEKPIRRWSPLVAGVLLFAFTGVGGENTDVLAHVTGFLAGLVIGWSGSGLPHRWLARMDVQIVAGLAAVLLVVSAWTIALAVAG
ncbi:Rhomboid family protein [Novipirellula galeiformis]|uniref:Rhomboid family protein n=1 Tax=Novipirellula galeiformis TaxID=2528004 RepID=A0A5C6C102_9BACT|nr:rhomboid family intramembrane serine protease [Novipirellula galeiformis]TWU17311.1 Rhomboid family protein [Novipirellula galeiformis]